MTRNRADRPAIVVSLAYLGLVTTTLLPLARRVAAARDAATCLSNVGQIGQALLLYAEDSDGALPGPVASDPINGGNSRRKPYDADLLPYIGAKEAFRCPADDLPRKNDSFWDGRYREERPGRSYAIVDRIVTGRAGSPDSTTGVFGRNLSALEVPDATVALAECWPYVWRGVSVSGLGSFPSHTLSGCDTWALAGRSVDDLLEPCATQYGDPETAPTKGHQDQGAYAMASGAARFLPWRQLAAHDFDAFRAFDRLTP